MDSLRSRYTNNFGLRENPFSATANPRSIYTNESFRQAFSGILDGIRACKGIMVLTGAVGTGKTCLAHKLSTELGATTHCVFLQNSHLDITHEIEAHETSLIEAAQMGKPVVLFIDDAQILPEERLAKLLVLSRPEESDKTSVQIVLVGMPELEDTLKKPGLGQFTHSIAVQCQLEPLKSDEIGAFILQQLHAVGCERDDLFSIEAIQQIALHSRGVPRLINILCNSAIFIAGKEASDVITAQIVDKAVQRSSLLFSTHAIPSPGQSVDTGNDMASDGHTTENLRDHMDDMPVREEDVRAQAGTLGKSSHIRDQPDVSAGLVIDPESPVTRSNTIARWSTVESGSIRQDADVSTAGRAGRRWYIAAAPLVLFLIAGSAAYIYKHEPETGGLLTAHSPVQAHEETPLMSQPPRVESISSMPSGKAENRAAGQAVVPVTANSTAAISTATHADPVVVDPAPAPALSATELAAQENAALRENAVDRSVQLESIQQDLEPAGHQTGATAGKESLSSGQARERLAQMGLPLSGQALVNSVKKGDTQVTELLLTAGVSPNVRDSLSGQTAMAHAAWNGDVAVVRRLLDEGVTANVRNSDGWTALTDAAINGHTTVVQTLLDAGADPNARDNDGKTALMAAVWNGHMETARALLDRDADVNSQNHDTWTALLYAAWGGHTEIARLLVERGADLEAANSEGQTALTVAQSQGHREIAMLIRAAENQ